MEHLEDRNTDPVTGEQEAQNTAPVQECAEMPGRENAETAGQEETDMPGRENTETAGQEETDMPGRENTETAGQTESSGKKQKKKHPMIRGIVIGVCGTLCVLTAAVGVFVYNGYRRMKAQLSLAGQSAEGGKEGINLDNVRDKLSVLDYLVNNKFLFQENLDAPLQEDYLYYGYVASLGDPYSRYYSKADFRKMQESQNGEYVGIGATVTTNPNTGNVEVISLTPGGPAEKGGILPGDIFYKVDEEYVTGKDLDLLIIENIRGKEGTPLTVTVYRPSEKKYIPIAMTREKIVTETIKVSMKDDIGLIRLTEFDEVTTGQFKNAVDTLLAQGANKLIFDLRNNPGGNLSAVLPCMDYILPDGGLMLKFKGLGDTHEEFRCEDGHEVSVPMAILVNENSASAAEAFSGALQDYGKAVLVGTQTFGKGIVQTTFPLGDGSAVNLTTQRYYTPKDQDIHGKGLTPDVECELAEGLIAGTQIPDAQDNQLQKAVEVVNQKAAEDALTERAAENSTAQTAGTQTEAEPSAESEAQETADAQTEAEPVSEAGAQETIAAN